MYTLWSHTAYLVKVVTLTTPTHVANLANEWLTCTNIWRCIWCHTLKMKISFNIFLVSTHSVCPYKNCGLKWSQKSQILHNFFYLVCNFQGTVPTKQKKYSSRKFAACILNKCISVHCIHCTVHTCTVLLTT